jgi:CheY-like chemotaxis protein
MVSDIQMDGMDGRDTVPLARARYPDDDFPILVMTSMTALEEREWVRALANTNSSKSRSARASWSRAWRPFR